MARPGRKRNPDAKRDSTGKARRPYDARDVAKAQRRKAGAAPGTEFHVEHECPIGRLLIAGEISRAQYDAGVRFREIDRRYRLVNGMPPPHTRAADWNAGGRLLKPDEVIEDVRRICTAYLDAINRMTVAGIAARQEVIHTAIYEREPMMIANLIAGLEALAK